MEVLDKRPSVRCFPSVNAVTHFLAPTGLDSIAQAEGLGKQSARTIHKPQRGATTASHAPLGLCVHLFAYPQAFSLGYRIRPRGAKRIAHSVAHRSYLLRTIDFPPFPAKMLPPRALSSRNRFFAT